jgi:hypothetical protein
MCGIRQQFFDRAASSVQQQFREDRSIKPPKYIQLCGHRENDVSMSTRQQLRRGPLKPLAASAALTLRTRTMSTGVVFNAADVPAVATLDMSAKLGRTALRDASGGALNIRSKFAAPRPRRIESLDNRSNSMRRRIH